MNRLLLTAFAIATIALTTPAEARRHHAAKSEPARLSTPGPDVAATPAYPTQDQIRAPGGRATAASRRRNGAGGHREAREARKVTPEPRQAESGSGIVRSGKTGATARVSPRFQPIAQAVVDDLEARGAVIKFMGGYRKGPCWSGGLHPCGLAIDLCQTGRGIVDRRCNLPSKAVEASVAAAHGALSGAIWCNGDRGHVQLGQTAGPCGSNLYAAVGEFQAKRQSMRRHHRIRLAHR